jgi:hypothetical protein
MPMRAWKMVAISMIVVAMTAGTASAGGNGYKPYRGRTSQSEEFRVLLHKHKTVIRLNELLFIATLTCEDQTTQDWGIGIEWFPRGPVLPDRVLTVDEVDPSEALHISGHFGPFTGRGHMTFSIPAFTADEQLQLCTTGDLTWAVHRSDVAPPSGAASAAVAGPDGTILIKIARDGSASVQVNPAA